MTGKTTAIRQKIEKEKGNAWVKINVVISARILFGVRGSELLTVAPVLFVVV
ncbi:hypothetical protein [Ruegeria arenilitoris]|uniref:hypothetical protein n=1 Tax=Ruegeria arenilitoris TaxID=1173585 RepID=UPI001C2BB7B8|nr:hypothetical protein [Ruegeria arenilitoris]